MQELAVKQENLPEDNPVASYVLTEEAGETYRVALIATDEAGAGLYEDPLFTEPFVVTGEDARGLALAPTGRPLLDDLDRARTVEDVTPRAAARALADALVEQFELLDVADVEDAGDGRLTVGVAGSVYGPLDTFDHPVASVFGTGLARHLDAPVAVEAASTDDDRYDAVVACSWDDATGSGTATEP